MTINEVLVQAPEVKFKPLTKAEFSSDVEKTKAKQRCSYIAAIDLVCQERNVDYEVVKKYLSKTLMDKVMAEAQHENMLKKEHSTNTNTLM